MTEKPAVHGVQTVTAYRISAPGQAPERERCRVVEEDALTIDVEQVGAYTLMWTPTETTEQAVGFTGEDGVLADTENPEALALATGFVFTEGIIGGLGDIRTMAMCPDTPGVLRMQLGDPGAVKTRRKNVMMTSSCGICGSREVIENNMFGLKPVPGQLRLDSKAIQTLMATMRERQEVFLTTGGTHAAAIFTSDGRILATAEDLGRHNALDKVIGKTLLAGEAFDGRGVVLSSRLSLEMITKAVRAGLEIVAAVGAPTSLAIDVADQYGVTLCAFVRGERLTVFTHPERITTLPERPKK